MVNLISVIDAPCGAGKTSWAIQHINESGEQERFLFITPFLSECSRIIKSCSGRNFKQPTIRDGHGRKIDSLIKLIRTNKNIATTHALFSNSGDEIIAELKRKRYTLIIDEALNVLSNVNLYEDDPCGEGKTAVDIHTLLQKNIIERGDDDRLIWDKESNLGKYNWVEDRARHNNLFMVDNDIIMWTFQQEFFSEDLFENIYLLGYQFGYQMQSYYFKYYNIPYEVFGIGQESGKYYLTRSVLDSDFRAGAKRLIEICNDEKLNLIATRTASNPRARTALSLKWYSENEQKYDTLRRGIINFWKNKVKCSSCDMMWTTFKDYKKLLGGKSIAEKNFVSLNARATNDYANRKCLCYMANRYMNPNFIRFFAKRDIHVDQDGFALSELIQWVWRSAIRNGQKISIYIPSERMRNLLKDWMEGKI